MAGVALMLCRCGRDHWRDVLDRLAADPPTTEEWAEARRWASEVRALFCASDPDTEAMLRHAGALGFDPGMGSPGAQVKLRLVPEHGEPLEFGDDRRAAVLVAIAVRLIQRPWLEDADVWDAEAHVTRGQVVVRCGDTAEPVRFKAAGQSARAIFQLRG